MSKEPPPFSRMLVGRDELQMVPGIGLVRAGQGESKVLLLLGQLLGWSGFQEAQIIYPKDPALLLFKCAGIGICRRGEERAHEVRHWTHVQSISFRERDGAGGAEGPGDLFGFL